jgi:hypothetical protein
MRPRALTPNANAVPFARPVGQAAHQLTDSVVEAVGVSGEAAQLRELADQDEEGDAVEIAVADRQR